MNVLSFKEKKRNNEKISIITCYDFTSALIAAKTDVDSILVGDSLAMTMHGYEHTISATMELMTIHTKAVAKGAKNKFIIADMPFLSFRKGITFALECMDELMKAGAHAVKIEGADGNLDLIRHTVESGIPVMGHLGLTPQSVHNFGGYKVQGKSEAAKDWILNRSKALEEAGCFSIVLECVPSDLAKNISQNLDIPTIGIGAGSQTDGQVLVWQDLLGFNDQFKPKFVRKYFDANEAFSSAINQFVTDTKNQSFPSKEESYL